MQKEVTFENFEELKDFQEYSKDKLAIAKVCVLSTAKNSHELDISEEVLRRDIGTIRGNFLVARMVDGEAQGHEDSEVPVGYFIPDKDIEFEEVEDNKGNKIVKAWAFAVLSKQYAKDAYKMFVSRNHRATSIEMKCVTAEDGHTVTALDAFGCTILGVHFKPSCADAEISLVRFAEKAQKFFDSKEQKMAEEKYENHPLNKDEDAVYTGEWDGEQAKKDLLKEEKFLELAPEVCLRLEEGWKDREITKLGYPIMGLFDGEWRYSTRALASALAYAKQNDEQDVLNKLKEIYDELDLNEEGKEDDEKMSKEVAFAAVDLNLMWTKINDELRARNYDWRWYIDGIFEQDNKKFVIIRNGGGDRFRINFSYTEDGLFMDDEMVKVDIEFIETDDIKRFSCPEEFKHLMGEEGEPKEPKDEPDEKDAIIMQKDAEIDELRKELDELKAYKAAIEEKEIAKRVEDILDEVKDYLDADKYQELRAEGLACGKDEIDAFGNKVKAQCFNAFKKAAKKDADKIFAFSKPIEIQKKDMSTMNVWDRIKENY